MYDFYCVICFACIVTMLREHFGSLRRALSVGVVQLVRLHRAFNIGVEIALTCMLAILATIVNGPARPVPVETAPPRKRTRAHDMDDPSLPV
jgi:hypothetical protein